MPAAETLLFVLGGLIAALVSGTTGFGFAVVATALWSQLAEPQRVTTLTLVLQLALNLAYLPFLWRELSLRRLAPFLVGALPGVPLGAWALGQWPAAPLRIGLGVLLVAWSAWMLRRGRWPRLALTPGAARAGDVVVGMVGGFLGGVAGLSGVLPALWCALRSDDKAANRGVVQGFILFTSVLGIVSVERTVGIDEPTRASLLLALPFVIVGGLIGLRVFSRLDTARFNRWLVWMVGGSGALLVLQSLTSP